MSSSIGKRMHVRPVGSGVVRDPGNRGAILPDGGRVVVVDEFWQRRIADRSVEATPAPVAAPRVPKRIPSSVKSAAPDSVRDDGPDPPNRTESADPDFNLAHPED